MILSAREATQLSLNFAGHFRAMLLKLFAFPRAAFSALPTCPESMQDANCWRASARLIRASFSLTLG